MLGGGGMRIEGVGGSDTSETEPSIDVALSPRVVSKREFSADATPGVSTGNDLLDSGVGRTDGDVTNSWLDFRFLRPGVYLCAKVSS